MKLLIRSTKFSDLQIGLILLILGMLGMAISLFFPGQVSRMPGCLFRAWTGVPCPSCGATHAGMQLSHAHLFRALRINPFFSLLYIGMALSALNAISGLIFGKNIAIARSERESRLLRNLLVLSVPLNWLYLVAVRFGLFWH
jgi:hypothetical protein